MTMSLKVIFTRVKLRWMHPYPKQILGEEKEAKIENKIRELLGETSRFLAGVDDLEMTHSV